MPRKPPMPAKLRQRAKAAKERHQTRPIAPEIEITAKANGWSYGNPYRPADELAWCALLLEAFGTRQSGVADVFISHLAGLCSSQWDQTAAAWRPNEHELRTAIAMVQSLAPRNEGEAALAAQAVAVHFATMKLAHNLAGRSCPDSRALAALAALSKAYVRQLEAMQALKGRKVSRQKITVRYEKHDHKHVHVHHEGGSAEFGGRVHEPRTAPAGEYEGSATLPRQNPKLVVVPVPSLEGEEALPEARRKIGNA